MSRVPSGSGPTASLALADGVGPVAGDGAVEGAVEDAESEMASRLRLAVTRLHRRLRQQTTGGLTPSQASALASIERLGSPTLGALAGHESVQPPSMTRIVGALEGLGYVSRVVDPDDRRVARVTASAEGREVLRRGRSLKNAFLAGQLHCLSADERESLGALTALLEHLVEVDGS